MSSKPKILFVGKFSDDGTNAVLGLREFFDVVQVPDMAGAVEQLRDGGFYGVFCVGPSAEVGLRDGCPSWNSRILEDLPDGVVLVDAENTIGIRKKDVESALHALAPGDAHGLPEAVIEALLALEPRRTPGA